METGTLSNPELFEALENFQLDDPDALLPFSNRLARDVGWSHRYALRVCDEYLRFLYLGMVASHPVTPSEEVDQAWHLHLSYTRSYWDELCAKVLKRPFHHGPTKGGKDEDALYWKQYAATLELYREEFGTRPPADIWPDTETRFAAMRYATFSPGLTFLCPKPAKSIVVVWTLIGAACGLVALSKAVSAGMAMLIALLPPAILAMQFAWQFDFERRSEHPGPTSSQGQSGGGCGSSGCGNNGCSGGCGGD
ncbi:MAG: hypothetical protein IOC54_03620 [Methylobacterium sp.]|jgi:hypothetical protein|nr:hypothetical protein [Methylobacterium sp.]MCA3639930.1 hypothetical protein [Methylobacterium sp.]MCA3646768.1 hypothetical protein [Methylobacterium sp.]MCA3650909.1 hypothetical protein [Methylobacterium sp.]MCA4923118.1 hypothetical protein [Methylobacterium sp.]